MISAKNEGSPARVLRAGRKERAAADTSEDRVRRIIERVRAIPKGFVRTYGDIDPRAPRLVGHVLATTEEDLPWHRVVRSDGRVAVGRRQLELLRREGVPIRGGRVDLHEARLPD
jgi:methylated-DNA-protein-cysteine methyltransferase-like protein